MWRYWDSQTKHRFQYFLNEKAPDIQKFYEWRKHSRPRFTEELYRGQPWYKVWRREAVITKRWQLHFIMLLVPLSGSARIPAKRTSTLSNRTAPPGIDFVKHPGGVVRRVLVSRQVLIPGNAEHTWGGRNGIYVLFVTQNCWKFVFFLL